MLDSRHHRAFGIFSVLLIALVVVPLTTMAQGVPEPDFIQYGLIRNVTSNANVPLVYGTLRWVFQPVGGGAAITNTLSLTNIGKQFSYLLRVRSETEVGGLLASSNALKLTATPTTYSRSIVTWNGQPVTFVQSALTNFTLSGSSRGRVERVDLDVSAPYGDSDNNGLIDDWERFYFGRIGVDPDGDDDHDGMSNQAEAAAGTDPTDANSVFKFIRIARHPQGGYLLEWQSTTNRLYALQRATGPTGGFADVQTGIAATPPVNSLWDIHAPALGPCYYRLRLDDGLAPFVLRMAGVFQDPLGGLSVQWLSASEQVYTLERSTNLSTGFIKVQTNIAATVPTNSFRDAGAAGHGPYFYRVKRE